MAIGWIEQSIFIERERSTLNQAAVDLVDHLRRIHRPAAIMHGEEFLHVDDAHFRIYFNLSHIDAAIGVVVLLVVVGNAPRLCGNLAQCPSSRQLGGS